MNKRDFIVQSGSTLLAGAAWLPAMGHAAPAPSGEDADMASALAFNSMPRRQHEWQALQGHIFDTHTALDRPVQLALSEVRAKEAAASSTSLQQFTVTLQGPRSLPLQAGLHVLHHPEVGAAALYLEPVHHGDQITYDAHFSLTL